MSVFERACLIIYRFAEKGLEVFLINEQSEESSVWSIPQQDIPSTANNLVSEEANMIEIDPIQMDEGKRFRAFAIEGDYHDIPSMRSLMKEDVNYVKDKIRTMVPELEQGTFVAVKEAFKKVLPHEYAMLKELREILNDRNLLKYL
ncbi:MAG: hypothetical protein IPL46_13220 [Saprospiraceae bacterium]|nr:hypothetical protein [Saprospiraceae bacterium]